MFNNPLKSFIEEASKKKGVPDIGPGGVLPEVPGGGTPGGPDDGTDKPEDLIVLDQAGFLARAASNSWRMNGHYRLAESVNVPEDWTPIGSSAAPFTGSFDGGGHAITGIAIAAGEADQGMFGVIGSNGVARNIHLEDVDISGIMHVGGIAGLNNGIVENCSVSGNIAGTREVGGIAGLNNGIVQNSLNTATVNASSNTAGGIAGHNSSIVRNSLNRGNIAANAYAGGVVGWNDAAGSVLRCVALNQAVMAAAVGSAHRIVGQGGGELVNNHARNDMQIYIGNNGNTIEGGAPNNDNNGGPLVPVASELGADPNAYLKLPFWEETLGWDFDTVWSFTGASPVLRKP